jgi:hypothetical protein
MNPVDVEHQTVMVSPQELNELLAKVIKLGEESGYPAPKFFAMLDVVLDKIKESMHLNLESVTSIPTSKDEILN